MEIPHFAEFPVNSGVYMSDHTKKSDFEPEEQGYTPASPLKRTMAWIALVYVLIFLALTTYFYFTGTMLGNLAPLLTVPGLLGLAVVLIVSWRTTGKPGKWAAIALAALCIALALTTLPLGIVGLMSNFGQIGVSVVVG
jgi:hypothetical protein